MAVWQSLARLLGFGDCPSDDAGVHASLDEAKDLEPGQVVGEYVIEQKLGEGGFGAVYRAVHPVIGKAAAVKVLHAQYSSNASVVSRFVSEARAVNQIRHRHIIDIFSFGSLDDGRHYYVMELLEGVTLEEYLDHACRLAPPEALPILQAVAKALEAAHDAGIAHRDLKPENVFLAVDDDGTVFPKILDFGVAKLLSPDGPGPSHKTHTGTPIGTPRYMSPEQCQGRKVDKRTDIYSFGVIAHRMLTGKLPFDATTALELMLMHVGNPPPRMSEVADVPAALDEPVLRMLEKDPDSRPACLSEAFEAMLAAASEAGIEQASMRISISDDVRQAVDAARTASRRSDRITPSGVQTPAGKGAAAQSPSSPVRGASRGRALLAIGAILAASGIAVFLFSTQGGKPVPSAAASFSAEPAVAPPSASSAVPAVSSSAVASGPSLPPPAPAVSVSWTFDTVPKRAEVFVGDERLGKAPGPFAIPRSEDKRKVIVRASGYHDEELELDARADRIVSVQLERRAPRPASTPSVPEDLEYPF